MKKILLSVAAAAIALTAVNAQAANGTVAFTGQIVKATCTVDNDSKNQSVFIGKYPTTAFSAAGDVTASKAFNIKLVNCDTGSYSLRFDGPTLAGYPNLLAVSAATGVGIEILSNDEKIIPINQTASTTALAAITNTAASGSTANGTATFNLKARYKSTTANVTEGAANASSTFTIEYN
ncbi:fimbrial protein [Erwinia sp. E602]|uniref:fimbrial protein n=1 Tax=unclassified Erwinia TaxID=2622719 RepID=UPI0006FD7F71|nr:MULTISPECIES: fimbrial protein [unclassified Erwinia]KQN64123.1 pilus assembly protein [Erwinia sp. Leaf53]PLV57819.1 pilus assembly protein [Erwinia sp. B116]QUG73897.1 fimbrial protein [Erwinia sp. E602]